eukprot:GHVS01069169.1.p1 GENE.GHVS01069169.1~~GHVS01069169.1.p1  ORF type:complete len:142 (-),score=6.99 GHVS01069169.1:177-602(-)
MLELVSSMDTHSYKLTFVTSATDTTSISALGCSKLCAHNNSHNETYDGTKTRDFDFAVIRRSREVGQSYITSCWTTLVAFIEALQLVYRTRPQLLLINGPGTCLPICYAALCCEVGEDCFHRELLSSQLPLIDRHFGLRGC